MIAEDTKRRQLKHEPISWSPGRLPLHLILGFGSPLQQIMQNTGQDIFGRSVYKWWRTLMIVLFGRCQYKVPKSRNWVSFNELLRVQRSTYLPTGIIG